MIKKYSITISGHTTSISLEPEFWAELKAIATEQDLSMNKLVEQIDQSRPDTSNLSQALRLYVFHHLKSLIKDVK